MNKDILFDIDYFITHEDYGIASYHEGQNLISLFEFDGEYAKQIEPDFPDIVCTQVLYYRNTLGIKETGNYLKYGGIGIGIWEYYNEDGTLTHTENMDEHFPITWEQLEQILKNKDISLLTVDSIFRYYDEEKDESTWSIIINLPMEKGQLYVFDARTGEIINEEIIDMKKQR
jgi:hypothetical protein